MKKTAGDLTLVLERTEDILKYLGENKRQDQILIGFAAETDDLIANAQGKLERKNLDFIIANDVSKSDRGFGSNDNAVTILKRSGEREDIELRSKAELAEILLAHLLCQCLLALGDLHAPQVIGIVEHEPLLADFQPAVARAFSFENNGIIAGLFQIKAKAAAAVGGTQNPGLGG